MRRCRPHPGFLEKPGGFRHPFWGSVRQTAGRGEREARGGRWRPWMMRPALPQPRAVARPGSVRHHEDDGAQAPGLHRASAGAGALVRANGDRHQVPKERTGLPHTGCASRVTWVTLLRKEAR